MSAPSAPPGPWKRDWHPDARAQHWTLAPDEGVLRSNKTGATRRRFAVLLQAFQCDGRLPERREDVAVSIVVYLARQTSVPPAASCAGAWSERTHRHQRAQIRAPCACRVFRTEDDSALVTWLSERVPSPNPGAEALKSAAYGSLRAQPLEPPAPERGHRLVRTAVVQREQRLVTPAVAQLGPATCAALDALVHTHGPEDAPDADQILRCPVRSALAAVKDGAGAVSGETVLEAIATLQQLRALGLPEGLVRAVPATRLTPYRQRAASEPPRAVRRHPPAMRSMLLAAFCWQRQQEITDTLVEWLIHIAHRVGVRAEETVDGALRKYAKQVSGKATLLYKLAKAAKGKPDGVVRDVIYSAVDEQTLDNVMHEAEAAATYAPQVKWVTRASYRHHYRRIVPALLAVLAFQWHNDLHRPVMDALALLDKYRDRKTTVFPAREQVRRIACSC